MSDSATDVIAIYTDTSERARELASKLDGYKNQRRPWHGLTIPYGEIQYNHSLKIVSSAPVIAEPSSHVCWCVVIGQWNPQVDTVIEKYITEILLYEGATIPQVRGSKQGKPGRLIHHKDRHGLSELKVLPFKPVGFGAQRSQWRRH